MRIPQSLVALVLLALAPALVAAPAAAQEDAGPFDALAPRYIGPAGMSGRVTDVEVVLSDRGVIYVGGATGGVFKSVDAGITWDPVFDDASALGVGAIAVFQPAPDLVWVGTGEGNPRNSAGVGRGLFRSRDGGETWEQVGFEDSERIHRILTHPTDPDVVYVGVMGPAWSDGEERGVYRTTDGGESWERVLYRNPSTGVADMVMDPSNPDKIFAAMWDFRRDPWFFTSGGPGSGLFVTRDGGDSWTRLTEEDGMPAGELGRIGVGISASDPDVVYALVEAEESALVRSDDGGRTWRTVSDEQGIVPRPFYYADLRVDPTNENRIYSLHSRIEVSEDQGRTWETVVPSAIIHGDVHELWIDPDDSRRMIMGNDGGIAFTYDRGDTWRFVENLTLAQFYHISLDDAVPYNVYGGLQDNGSWYGPTTVWENKGILNAHWRRVGGGDGFTVMDDPSSPDHGYSMSQGGNLQRFDKVTGERESIRPVHPDGTQLRFNWNAGLSLDPIDSTTIYLGSQFVHRSRDHGASWEIISPDLTTDDPEKQRAYSSGGLTTDASGAEMHTTIISVQASPLEEGLIWVGTDDGNVQVTRDGGESWTNVRDEVPGLPEGIWIPDVQPSVHEAGRAYLVAEDHRRGDWTSRVYVTEDYGESWRSLTGEGGIDAFVHAIEEDPHDEDLLFLGTEFGLRTSLDRGEHWHAMLDVPAVPVRDLKIQPRESDLVLGTHGRGAIVFDDIRPVRALADRAAHDRITQSTVHLFAPPPARRVEIAEAIGYRSTGMAMQQAETRPYGALLTFWAAEPGEARVEVRDAAGSLVWSDEVDAVTGMNRLAWDLRPGGDADEEEHPRRMEVLPGEYAVEIEKDGVTSRAALRVVPDPRGGATMAELRAKRAALQEAAALIAEVDALRDRVEEAQERVDMVLETLPDDADALRERGEAVGDSLQALVEAVWTGPPCPGLCREPVLADAVDRPYGALASAAGAPSENEEIMMRQARAAAAEIRTRVEAVMTGPVAAYRQALLDAGYTPLGDVGGDR